MPQLPSWPFTFELTIPFLSVISAGDFWPLFLAPCPWHGPWQWESLPRSAEGQRKPSLTRCQMFKTELQSSKKTTELELTPGPTTSLSPKYPSADTSLDDAARQLPLRPRPAFISPDVFRPLIWDGVGIPVLSQMKASSDLFFPPF